MSEAELEQANLEDGDVTFGCGMFNAMAADACTCLISEARVAEGRSRPPAEWLWSPTWRDAHISYRRRSNETNSTEG